MKLCKEEQLDVKCLAVLFVNHFKKKENSCSVLFILEIKRKVIFVNKKEQIDFILEYYEFLRDKNPVVAGKEFYSKLDKVEALNDISKDTSMFIAYFLSLASSLDEKSFARVMSCLSKMGEDFILHKVKVRES